MCYFKLFTCAVGHQSRNVTHPPSKTTSPGLDFKDFILGVLCWKSLEYWIFYIEKYWLLVPTPVSRSPSPNLGASDSCMYRLPLNVSPDTWGFLFTYLISFSCTKKDKNKTSAGRNDLWKATRSEVPSSPDQNIHVAYCSLCRDHRWSITTR